MTYATELYHVPLKRLEYVIGDFKIPLKTGLLSTLHDLESLLNNTSSKLLRTIGEAFKVPTRDLDKIKKLIIAATQCEWYRAKGSALPDRVTERYNITLQEANTVSEEPTSASETSPSDESTSSAVKSTRVGTRPYCRTLINEGETNEQVLLDLVHAKFPEKASVFKVADVRGCLRNAGKLDWTKRKGSKKAVETA